jgi:protein-tyrosine phosphatase
MQNHAGHGIVAVDSAGTADYHVGEPPDSRSVSAALTRGYDLSAMRARQVGPHDFERFDLLLAMDAQNLATLQRRAPSSAQGKLKLLLDFAPEQPLREVPDPYYGSASDFERVLDLAEAAARGLIANARRGC